MITSVFSKSRPINYILVTILLVLAFLLCQLNTSEWIHSFAKVVDKILLLCVLVCSVFVSNFITKKNGLSKDNSYSFLLFFAFLILFPTIFVNTNIIISNFFVLLALRRLISLQSLVTPKEKIFDASFWICMAALFHFWSILFILLVFISIIFHVSRDYRNWIIPFIAFSAVVIIYVLADLVFDKTLIFNLLDKVGVEFNFQYFDNKFQNIAFVFYTVVAVVFLFNQIFTMNSKPINLHASYKKIIFTFIIGVVVFVLSTHKNNSFLVFTFAPMSIMGANLIESFEKYWMKEALIIILLLVGMIIYISQLPSAIL
ncbi:DUF6427 family protein [Flavobacterium sp. '19STA2R22 D10 B1']|uniref:DUF6427 family protein n=1 Tax=Flavobacterium aerium TaxID=3037261 RepID=UPI00278C626F|nr:DUF6427 family protein [Flavobacterium sp. '19STA2R22 D10 B1']